MNIPYNSTLLFIGDSITEAGRTPSGEASPWEPNFGLGGGYVSKIYGWIHATHPASGIRVVNEGVSGQTVRDLATRWQTTVLAKSPQTLCVMIGINDVWRQFDSPLRPEIAVQPKEYRATLERLVSEAQSRVKTIFVATPYFIEPNKNDPMRRRMDEYGEIVKKIATRRGVPCVDTQAAFDTVLNYIHPMTIAWDRIHPDPVGHTVIAQAFLKAFGFVL